MSRNRLNGWWVILLSLALLLPAASAFAQVVNRNFTISDKNEADTTGTANHTGASNSGSGQTICRNGSSTVTISGTTTHPEKVSLSDKSASLEQGDPTNKPTIRVIGAVGLVFNVVLNCDEAEFESLVKLRLPRIGRFRVRAEQCGGLTLSQANYVRDTCAADPGNRTVDFDFDEAVMKWLRIRAKGPAT